MLEERKINNKAVFVARKFGNIRLFELKFEKIQ